MSGLASLLVVTVPPDLGWWEWLDGLADSDEQVDHLECCRKTLTLCGEDDPAGDYCEPDCGHGLCAVCERIDELGLPCGAPFCRLRRRMPWRRSS